MHAHAHFFTIPHDKMRGQGQRQEKFHKKHTPLDLCTIWRFFFQNTLTLSRTKKCEKGIKYFENNWIEFLNKWTQCRMYCMNNLCKSMKLRELIVYIFFEKNVRQCTAKVTKDDYVSLRESIEYRGNFIYHMYDVPSTLSCNSNENVIIVEFNLRLKAVNSNCPLLHIDQNLIWRFL